MAQVKRINSLLSKLEGGTDLTKKQGKELARIVKAALDEIGQTNFRACSKAQTCAVLSIDKRTLQNWLDRGCPRETTGGKVFLDPGKLLTWRIQYQQKLDRENSITEYEKQKRFEEIELLKERRRKAKVETDIKLKRYVLAVDAWSSLRTAAMILKSSIDMGDDLGDAINRAQEAFNKIVPIPKALPGLPDFEIKKPKMKGKKK